MLVRLLALVLALWVLPAVAATDPPPNQPDPPPNQPDAPPTNVTAPPDHPAAKEALFWHVTAEDLIAIGTVGLAIFTALLWMSTRALARDAAKTSSEAQIQSIRQAQALRDIERAYLFVDVTIDSGRIVSSPSGMENFITVNIWNHGKTPAELTKIRAYAFVSKKVPTELISAPGTEVTLPPGLAIAQNFNYPVAAVVIVKTDEHEDIENLRTNVFCVGSISYKDVFGTERQTNFCWFYRPHPIEGKFAIVPESTINSRT